MEIGIPWAIWIIVGHIMAAVFGFIYRFPELFNKEIKNNKCKKQALIISELSESQSSNVFMRIFKKVSFAD